MKIVRIKFFCLLLHLSCFHAAEKQEKTLSEKMYTALVFDRSFENVQGCLQQGFRLAQFYINGDTIDKKSFDKRQKSIQWMHEYFSYPQSGHIRSKNLMELLLMNERSYKISQKKVEFLLIAKILIEYGADVQAQGMNQNTIAHVIATLPKNSTTYPAQMDLLESLSDRGVTMNDPNRYGDTPLHLAMQADQPNEMLRLMIKAGGNMYALNHNNQTPYDFAVPEKKYALLLSPLHFKKTCKKDAY